MVEEKTPSTILGWGCDELIINFHSTLHLLLYFNVKIIWIFSLVFTRFSQSNRIKKKHKQLKHSKT